MRDTLKLLYGTFKLRIGFAIMLTALAGAAIAPGAVQVWPLALVALAVLLASSSAGAFNQLAERDLDRRMLRTRSRPFASGRFRASPAWLAFIVLLTLVPVIGVAVYANPLAAALVFLGAFFYGVVYTLWLKRTTVWNIVIGGLSGSFAVLAGAATVTPELGLQAILLALVLFLWTPPHFWSLAIVYRDDYARAQVPMLPVVVGNAIAAKIICAHTLALALLALVPACYGMGFIYLICAAAGGILFTYTSLRLVATPDVAHARLNFRASLVQLSLLLLGTIADAWIIG